LKILKIVLLTILIALAGIAESISSKIVFSADEFSFSKSNGYDLVVFKDKSGTVQGKVGYPCLPVKSVCIALPKGKDFVSFQTKINATTILKNSYKIYPTQIPHSISDKTVAKFTGALQDVYASKRWINLQPVQFMGCCSGRGKRFAIFSVSPFKYRASDGKLILRSNIELNIKLKDRAVALAKDDDNYRSFAMQTADKVKYLIIAANSFSSALKPFVTWKTQKGVPAKVVTIATITANYTGADVQEKIKRCIKDYVDHKETSWVLLVGDDTIIPDRNCYGSVAGKTDNTIPTDLYYATLDELDWDLDNNGKAGEMGNDNVDLMADVIVGRWPVRIATDVTNLVDKTIAYEKYMPATSVVKDFLLVGVELYVATDAQHKSDKMYADSIQPYWNVIPERFYDSASDNGKDVTADEFNNYIKTRLNFVHIATHGSQTAFGFENNSYYSTASVAGMGCDAPPINLATVACLTNSFDSERGTADPCLSEAFMRKKNNGAVTYIGSSREGWGVGGLEVLGPSFIYNSRFYELLFQNISPNSSLKAGAIFYATKDTFIAQSLHDSAYRWLQFSLNFMGDPELSLYTKNPQTLHVSYPTEIPPHSVDFLVKTGVQGATVCLWKGDEVYCYGLTDANGNFTRNITPTSTGSMKVTVTANNHLPYLGTIEVKQDASLNYVNFKDISVQAEEDTGQIAVLLQLSEPAEKELAVELRCSGNAQKNIDYTINTERVVFAQGETQAEVIITLINDNLDEANEKITLFLQNASELQIGTNRITSITIEDDDLPPHVSLSVADNKIPEDASGNTTITATLNTVSAKDIVLHLAYTGMATQEQDFIANSTIIIPAGSLQNSTVLQAKDDNLVEGVETITANISQAENAIVSNSNSVTIELEDDESVVLEFITTNLTLPEKLTNYEQNITVRLIITGDTGATLQNNLVIPLSILQTSTADVNDYQLSTQTLIFTQGNNNGSEQNFAVTIKSDQQKENQETLFLEFDTANTIAISPQNNLLTIKIDDYAPTVNLTINQTKSYEDNPTSTTTITATINTTITWDLTVNLSFSGDAKINTDYTCPNTITIPAGTQQASININFIDDNLAEKKESLISQIVANNQYIIGTNNHVTTIIEDDEKLYIAFINSNSTVSEQQQEFIYPIAMQLTITGDQGVTLAENTAITIAANQTSSAKATIDYQFPANNAVIFPAGSTGTVVANFNLTIIDDNIYDPNEKLILDIADTTYATTALQFSRYELNIQNIDSPPHISFQNKKLTIWEGETNSSVKILLDKACEINVTATITTTGTATLNQDYRLPQTTITIPAGTTTAEYHYTLIHDNYKDNLEQLIFTISNAQHATISQPAQTTITITDNKNPPIITEGSITNLIISEDSNPVPFALTLHASDEDAENIRWQLKTLPNHGTANIEWADLFANAESNTASWTMSGLWHLGNTATNGQFSFVYNQPTTGNYNTGTANQGSLISPSFYLHNGSSLSFWSKGEGETDNNKDTRKIYISTDSIHWQLLYQCSDNTNQWQLIKNINLASYAEQNIRLKFTFDTVDNAKNNQFGWAINDIRITGTNSLTPRINYQPNLNWNGDDSFIITANDGWGKESSITINVTVSARNDAPINTSQPTIQGVVHANSTITANTGIWLDSQDLHPGNITYTYQWWCATDPQGTDATSITGATQQTYTISPKYNNKYLRLEVTATDDGEGEPTHATSTAFSQWYQVVNHLPICNQGLNIQLNMSEDSNPNPFALTLTATDDDNDSLAWKTDSPPQHGQLQILPNNNKLTIDYTPTQNWFGIDTFIISLTDQLSPPKQIAVTITVQPINDQPTILAPVTPLTATEDSQFTYQVNTYDIDDINDGTNLLFQLINAPQGMTISSTGLISWTPTNNIFSSGKFSVQVKDGGEDNTTPAKLDMTISVTPINDPPQITSTPPLTATEDQTYSYQLIILDVDDENNGTDLTFRLINAPQGMTISNTGLLQWTPHEGIKSSGNITIQVNDGGENNAQPIQQNFIIKVIPVNDAPTFDKIPATSAMQDENYQAEIIASDVDNTIDQLFLTVEEKPQWLTLSKICNGKWQLSAIPTNSQVGTHTIKLLLKDTAGAATPLQYNFTIINKNDAPIISPTTTQLTINEDTTTTIQLSAQDIDNDTLSWIVTQQPQHANLSITNTTTGIKLQIQPTQNWHSDTNFDGVPDTNITFTIQVNDNNGGSDSANFQITVLSINDLPQNTTLPTITGIAKPEQILTIDYGIWNDNADPNSQITSYNLQWQISTNPDDPNTITNISGAVLPNYTIKNIEQNQYIRCKVKAFDTQHTFSEAYTRWLKIADDSFIINAKTAQGDSKQLQFGNLNQATDKFDQQIDQKTHNNDWIFWLLYSDTREPQKLLKDYRSIKNCTRWKLVVNIPNSQPYIDLNWDTTQFEKDGFLTIMQQIVNEKCTGKTILLNKNNELRINQNSQYEIVSAPIQTTTITCKQGWNLISNNIMSSQQIKEIFAQIKEQNPSILAVVTWDGKQYHNLNENQTIPAENGIWIYATKNLQSLTIKGILADGKHSLTKGWNLFAPVKDMPVPSDDNIQIVWSWNPEKQSYQQMTTGQILKAGKAYWLECKQNINILEQ